MTTTDAKLLEGIDEYKYDFRNEDVHVFQSPRKGLDAEIVAQISAMKNEPQWMLDFRLKALAHFESRPMPAWGGDLSKLNLDEIYFYTKPTEGESRSWDDVPDNIKTTFDRLGIPEAEQKFLAGVGAQYECLSEDTGVYTQRGVVPIRDIQAGDIVFSLDENTKTLVPSPVKAKAFKGDRKIFEIRVGTRIIKATENHPFYVLDYHRGENRQRGRFTPRWKYLRDIKEGDLVCVAKDLPDVGRSFRLKHPEIKTHVVGRNQSVDYDLDITDRYNNISLPEMTNEDLMWWLGFYIGDGFIHYQEGADKARVEIAIHEADDELRTEFEKITEKLFSIAAKNGDPYRLTIYSTILARFLEEIGFAGKAHEKRIPEWVASLPQAEILSFLGGYVDADGYVRDHPRNKDILLTSVNVDLLQEVRNLAALCGLPTSNLHRFESKHPVDRDRSIVGYRVQFYGDFERLACRSDKRTSRFGRRKFYHKFSSAEGTQFRTHTSDSMGFVRVNSITPAGISPVYDIEVDGPHNFVAEGLIVHNSEMVYHSIKEHLAEQGVIFKSIEHGLQEHEDLFREYFGTVIPIEDNKFAALNSAVWSGGSFVYVPPGVTVDMPLQAYFRINTAELGQFERTLIIIDEGAQAHYVEGCTAPIYSTDSFHSGVIEIVVKKGARMRYTTIQNWSKNMYNLVTQRAYVNENATMEWVDANLGSRLTMKYPSCYLLGEKAHGEILSLAFAADGQHQDTGGKVLHFAPNTTSKITSKSISKSGGRASYRGLLKVHAEAEGSTSNVVCDALLLDDHSRSDTYPYIEIDAQDVTIGHEASVSKVGEEQLFYLMSRGLSEEEATTMVVAGFIEPLVKELPMEYAVEMNRLIQLQMEGSIG